MNKIRRSGKLLKAAFAVLFREKKLLLFPFIMSLAAMVVAVFFLIPVVLYPTGHSCFTAAHWSALGDMFVKAFASDRHAVGHAGPVGPVVFLSSHWWAALICGVIYFVSMFTATFCNVAFYHEIMQSLNGNAVSIRRGFQFALTRWQAVLLWSVFAGLVGYAIRAIEERMGFLGRFIMGFIGLAWSVACIFIIPTLVRDTETVNPVKLLRNSAGTLKRTWGELVIGHVGLELAFSFVTMFLLCFSLLTGGVVMFLACEHYHLSQWWILAVILAEVFLLAVPMGIIGSVVNPVYRCALYIYATEGVVPDSFDQELLDSAWKVK